MGFLHNYGNSQDDGKGRYRHKHDDFDMNWDGVNNLFPLNSDYIIVMILWLLLLFTTTVILWLVCLLYAVTNTRDTRSTLTMQRKKPITITYDSADEEEKTQEE
jgi:hypothetical protein